MSKDIKILENLKEKRYRTDDILGNLVLNEDELKAIENLIQKNKELEEELENWKFTTKYVEDNYIDKGKIILKIDRLQNSDGLEDNIAIPYLQELLGK